MLVVFVQDPRLDIFVAPNQIATRGLVVAHYTTQRILDYAAGYRKCRTDSMAEHVPLSSMLAKLIAVC